MPVIALEQLNFDDIPYVFSQFSQILEILKFLEEFVTIVKMDSRQPLKWETLLLGVDWRGKSPCSCMPNQAVITVQDPDNRGVSYNDRLQ